MAALRRTRRAHELAGCFGATQDTRKARHARRCVYRPLAATCVGQPWPPPTAARRPGTPAGTPPAPRRHGAPPPAPLDGLSTERAAVLLVLLLSPTRASYAGWRTSLKRVRWLPQGFMSHEPRHGSDTVETLSVEGVLVVLGPRSAPTPGVWAGERPAACTLHKCCNTHLATLDCLCGRMKPHKREYSPGANHQVLLRRLLLQLGSLLDATDTRSGNAAMPPTPIPIPSASSFRHAVTRRQHIISPSPLQNCKIV